MTTPQPSKWQETPGITKQEVSEKLAEMFGIPVDSLRSWTVIIHVHDAAQHSTQVASSFDDVDMIAEQIMAGVIAL